MLNGKNVLLAVTGSIAAYKAAFITRLLIKAGASVKIIMTEASMQFVTPVTLSTLSKNPVLKDFIKNDNTGEWNNHVDLGLWADIMLIAPATANILSKLTTGHADSLLMATYLSARCPVYVAPAMDLDMYTHASTQANLNLLQQRGDKIISPESGELASGLEGQGRLAEPENIVSFIEEDLKKSLTLYGKRILITAGPTHEAIDPVRYIGNQSSGKMGFALAEEAQKKGAEVTLISGPVALLTPPSTTRLDVVSAGDMFETCKANYKKQDIIIMAAAVADYTPEIVSSIKIKKKSDDMIIPLKKTQDVLQWIGSHKNDNQLLVGFALETNDGIENAKEKLDRKNLDLIVLNTLEDRGAGFQHNTNKITIIDKNNKIDNFELKSKQKVALDILNKIESLIK